MMLGKAFMAALAGQAAARSRDGLPQDLPAQEADKAELPASAACR